MKIGWFTSAAGLALSTAALAAGSPLVDFRALSADVDGQFEISNPSGQKGYIAEMMALDGRVVTLSEGRGATSVVAGDRAGTLVSATDNLDCLNPFPAIIRDQLGCPVWSDGSITGTNFWLGTTTATRVTYAVTDTIAGNSTVKCRLMATTAITPDQFFFGFRYEFRKINGAIPGPGVRFAIRPDTGKPLYVEHDLYVSTITTLYTSEPIYVTSGFISSRLLWGGTCVGDAQDPCESFGLPTGVLPFVYTLGVDPNSFTTGIFRTCKWVGTAPTGEVVGGDVEMPTNQWIRVRHETNASGDVVEWLNLNDSTGYHKCYEEPFLTTLNSDSLGGNGSWEVANAPAYYDNISYQGVEVVLPVPPNAFECGASGYQDDIEWLNAGPLFNQNAVWFDALSSKANVDTISGSKKLRQTNLFPDDRYREEFSRTLPLTTASAGSPWTLCEETRLSAGIQVRGFTPTNNAGGTFVSRIFFNFQSGAVNTAMIDVQFNSAYAPIDDEGIANPYMPGPNGNGGVRRVTAAPASIGDTANFDSFDTGADPATGGTAAQRTLCFGVDVDGNITMSYGGVDLVGGSSGIAMETFTQTNSIDEWRHESENNSNAAGRNLFIDNIDLQCTALPLVAVPPFTLRYFDDMETYLEGVTLGIQDDDGVTSTPFRWGSANNMIIVNLGAKTKALCMENLFQDTTQTVGDFTLFNQAATRLPPVTASSTRGWGVRTSAKFTDFTTTRSWSPAAATFLPSTFALGTFILFSPDSGTFWTLQPDPIDPINNDDIWTDTGRTPASLGIAANQWFTIGVQRNLNGSFLYFVNGQFLRDSTSAIVFGQPLQSTEFGVHKDLGALFYFGGDDATAPDGSILYADNVVAWATPCLGDTNHDGLTDFTDLNNVLGVFNTPAFGNNRPNMFPDANNDGVADDDVVNFGDLNLVTGQFNQNCN